jgi:hypothetical protein
MKLQPLKLKDRDICLNMHTHITGVSWRHTKNVENHSLLVGKV